MEDANEEKLLRAVTLQNARAILHARERAEQELRKAKEELERSNQQITELLAREREVFAKAEKEIADRKQAEEALRESEQRLRQANAELAQRVAELQQATAEIRDSRRAALNLMEDAIQARAVIAQSEERFRSLVSVMTDVPWITDPTGAFIARQPAFEAYTGQSWEEHRGFGWANALHADDREQIKATWERACKNRTLYESHGRLWHAPSGECRYFVARATPLLNPDGTVREWVGTCTDIHERKQAEAALRQSEEKFKLLFERSPLPKWAFDVETLRFVDVNEAAVQHYGYSREEFLRMSILDVRTPEAGQALQAALARPGRRLPESETCQHRQKSGASIDVEVRFSEITLAGKQVWLASINDITARKQAEEERARLLASEQQARQEAEEANRVKDEFLATVSHELRTPLNSILGWANMLLRGGLDEEAAARAIETIARNARAQNQLISDLLDVSRIITGKLRFEVGAVDLIPVIEAALETVRPAAEAKGVELRLTLDPAAGQVLGDADRLQQVVWNLLTNAIKYTPRGGHVETRLEREGSHAAIIVRDTGEGISADFLPYVFTRFRQADGATTRQHGGLGLGLAIVRHLVEAHGGQVRAASEGAGRGAAFTVTLPAIRDEGGGMKDESEGVFNHPSSLIPHPLLTGLRVLVVEDDQDSRELLRLTLTEDGAEVKSGASATEALEILDQWRPDVLVSDIGMPEVDGYELMRQVRSLPAERGGQIPAVALTGYASPEDERRVHAAGFQMFMPKPVELPELVAAIARLAVESH